MLEALSFYIYNVSAVLAPVVRRRLDDDDDDDDVVDAEVEYMCIVLYFYLLNICHINACSGYQTTMMMLLLMMWTTTMVLMTMTTMLIMMTTTTT